MSLSAFDEFHFQKQMCVLDKCLIAAISTPKKRVQTLKNKTDYPQHDISLQGVSGSSKKSICDWREHIKKNAGASGPRREISATAACSQRDRPSYVRMYFINAKKPLKNIK